MWLLDLTLSVVLSQISVKEVDSPWLPLLEENNRAISRVTYPKLNPVTEVQSPPKQPEDDSKEQSMQDRQPPKTTPPRHCHPSLQAVEPPVPVKSIDSEEEDEWSSTDSEEGTDDDKDYDASDWICRGHHSRDVQYYSNPQRSHRSTRQVVQPVYIGTSASI